MEEDRQKRNQQRREWHNKMRQVAAEMGVEPRELTLVVTRLQDEKLCRRFIQWLEHRKVDGKYQTTVEEMEEIAKWLACGRMRI